MKLGLVYGLQQLDPSAYFGFEGWLMNPEKDAVVMAEQLLARGYEIRGGVTERATRGDFTDQMSAIAGELQAGDTFFLHYSGHGSDEGGLFDSVQSFCFYDGQLSEVVFRELLARFRTGVKVICSLDCCHAGGFDRALDGRIRPRVVPQIYRSQFAPVRVGELRSASAIGAQVLLACACKGSETASDGDLYGEWTNGESKAMVYLATVPTTTWRDWFTLAALYTQGQTPQLKQLGAPGLIDQPAFT